MDFVQEANTPSCSEELTGISNDVIKGMVKVQFLALSSTEEGDFLRIYVSRTFARTIAVALRKKVVRRVVSQDDYAKDVNFIVAFLEDLRVINLHIYSWNREMEG